MSENISAIAKDFGITANKAALAFGELSMLMATPMGIRKSNFAELMLHNFEKNNLLSDKYFSSGAADPAGYRYDGTSFRKFLLDDIARESIDPSPKPDWKQDSKSKAMKYSRLPGSSGVRSPILDGLLRKTITTEELLDIQAEETQKLELEAAKQRAIKMDRPITKGDW